MAIIIRNLNTGDAYTEAATLQAARRFCEQRLLRSTAGREAFLSGLAAGIIDVCDARCTNYRGAGF